LKITALHNKHLKRLKYSLNSRKTDRTITTVIVASTTSSTTLIQTLPTNSSGDLSNNNMATIATATTKSTIFKEASTKASTIFTKLGLPQKNSQ